MVKIETESAQNTGQRKWGIENQKWRVQPQFLGKIKERRWQSSNCQEYGVSADIGGSLGREKDLGGDKVRTVREGSFILGSQTGSIYSMAVSGDYIGNSKTSWKREFTGPGFTIEKVYINNLVRKQCSKQLNSQKDYYYY